MACKYQSTWAVTYDMIDHSVAARSVVQAEVDNLSSNDYIIWVGQSREACCLYAYMELFVSKSNQITSKNQ